jgi:hypothetical protein
MSPLPLSLVVPMLFAADPVLQLPNRTTYWEESGFHRMDAPLRLPSDADLSDTIEVWLKLPETGRVSVQWVAEPGETRPSLVYPRGTVADRVEFFRDSEGVADVRGARIDEAGRAIFHVLEVPRGGNPDWLRGYEWARADDAADMLAADKLVALLYSGASPSEKESFRAANHCSACHAVNLPRPAKMDPRLRHRSDAYGFFQPTAVIEKLMTVRINRSWDTNFEDPFISVRCGPVLAEPWFQSGARGYRCADGSVPLGELDFGSALSAGDEHAAQVCAAREYLHQHMDDAARAAYAESFQVCGIGE